MKVAFLVFFALVTFSARSESGSVIEFTFKDRFVVETILAPEIKVPNFSEIETKHMIETYEQLTVFKQIGR